MAPIALYRRKGLSLVEVMLSLSILMIVLLGMMAGIVIAKNTVETTDVQSAREIAITALENYEATPFESLGIGSEDRRFVSVFRIITRVEALTPFSADISATVNWNGANGEKVVQMNREVSASGWQNAGVLPNP
jgi:Type II secretory pathway, component PulJ